MGKVVAELKQINHKYEKGKRDEIQVERVGTCSSWSSQRHKQDHLRTEEEGMAHAKKADLEKCPKAWARRLGQQQHVS